MVFNYRYGNFYEVLEKFAKSSPHKAALFEEGKKVSYLELKLKTDSLSRFLDVTGAKKEDKIALLLRNSKEFIISLLACSKLGCVCVPINTFLKEEEIEYILNDSKAKILIASAKFKSQTKTLLSTTKIKKIIWEGNYKELDKNNISFEEASALSCQMKTPSVAKVDDLAVIFYTSGTTGKPKGAMITYRNLFSNIFGVEAILKLSPSDRFIAYLPMFYSFTFTINILLPLYFGSAIAIVKSVFPFSNVIKEVLFRRVTIFTGVPDIYKALAKAKIPWYFFLFNRVKIFVSGAASLPKETIKKFTKKFKRSVLLEGYGLSECSPVVCVNLPKKQKIGSVGPAVVGVEVKIVNEDMIEVKRGEIGEIIVKGDNVMRGYLNNEEATAETIINGWLKTGDLGYMDKDGFVYIVDRKKDLIISKGINIYPREIEEILQKNPYIKAAAVIGEKDKEGEEHPAAYIELEEGIKTNAAEIKRYLKEHLANFKIPKNIYFLKELPKNATGKVLKRKLKK